MTSSTGDDGTPLELLVEEFLERQRRGEHPAVSEYTAAYPELADEIRELLPVLAMVERFKPVREELAATPSSADRSDLGAACGRLGDYRLLRMIDVGGMGIVYEAERESLACRVALKVIKPEFRSSASYLRRFHTEARAAARLHHTNIVGVFDYGEHDGVYYYAMQYIAGHGLDVVLDDVRRLRRANAGSSENEPPKDLSRRTVVLGVLTGQYAAGPSSEAPDTASVLVSSGIDGKVADGPPTGPEPLINSVAGSSATDPPGESGSEATIGDSPSSILSGTTRARYHLEVARIGAQVADALAYAHRRGVLHRDIKPSNLLLDAMGNVWVTDFGLARFEEGEDLSRSHDPVGTLRYMAPERFRGISQRGCDVYALGATLYELLTLRPAFGGQDQLQLVSRIAHEPPTPPRRIDRQIPRDLETIVLKAMAKDPRDRFATAQEMGAELKLFLENRPLRSRPVPLHGRLWRWGKRNPALASVVGLAATLTIILAIGSTVAAWTFFRQRNETRTAEREARLALGQSLVSEGAALQRTGQIGQRFESLNRLAQAAKVLGSDFEGRKRLPEIRNHAIAALGLTDLRNLRTHDCGDVYNVRVDPSLKRYVYVEKSGEIVVRGLDDDRELVRLPAPVENINSYPSCIFSPDGELLVAGYSLRAGVGWWRVWHLGRRELLEKMQKCYGLVFHPSGRCFYFSAVEGGIGVWDREQRRIIRRLPLDYTPNQLALEPDGRRLAVNNTDRAAPRVTILELDTGRVLADWRSQVGIGGMSWSTDGQLLAVAGGDNDKRVYVWNVGRGSLASVLPGQGAPRFAHSGYLLATLSADGKTCLWDAAAGEPLTAAPGNSLGFSPDDRRLAFMMDGKLGVWNVAGDTECRTLCLEIVGNRSDEVAPPAIFSADFSPDSKLMTTSHANGVRLWEADTGRELAHLKAGSCGTALFHPDGESLISSGNWGTYRWPIRPDFERGAGVIRVGPPELVRETTDGEWGKADWLPDHRTLALIDNANVRVLLVDSSNPHAAGSRARILDSGRNRRMTTVAVSPDGRWLATGGWYEKGVQVWDLHRRGLPRILRPREAIGITKFFVGFSRDGRWLVSSAHPDASPKFYQFWHVGSWDPGFRIDLERNGAASYPTVFTGDGRLMALGIAPDQVMLADAATGRELARLTSSQSLNPEPMAFSPDGTKLIARTSHGTALIWDLRRIRDQLAEHGLDWDAPPYPMASEPGNAPSALPLPRSVQVVGEVIEPVARRAVELAEMNRRVAAEPDDAEALIHRGWLFIRQRKWPEAITDLEHRLRLRPGDPEACWLLAEAYLGRGKLAGALTALSRLLDQAPHDHDVRFERGLVALASRRPNLAREDFRQILAAEPDDDEARYPLAQSLIRLGRHREALAELDILIRNRPSGYWLYYLRGTARDALGDHEQARADEEKATELMRNDATTLNDQAWVDANGPITKRDPDRALVLARRAVALLPDRRFLNTLGVALYRVGQYAEAIPVLDQSLATGKGDFAAYDLFLLAMAHQKLGHASQARACYDRAVRWCGEQKNLPAENASELTDFRAEAGDVLAETLAQLPAEVFAPE